MSELFDKEAKIYRPTKRIKSAKYQKGMDRRLYSARF